MTFNIVRCSRSSLHSRRFRKSAPILRVLQIRSSLTRYKGHPPSFVTSCRKTDRSYRDHLSNPFSSSRAFSRRLAQDRQYL